MCTHTHGKTVTVTRTVSRLLGAGISAYDDAVPHTETNLTLAARFAVLRGRRPAVDLRDVREVVAVVSSSRGGSTMLSELLRRSAGLLSLPGEMNPYVAVAHISGHADVVAAELAREVGRPAARPSEATGLVESLMWRLLAQWPDLDAPLDVIHEVVQRAVHGVGVGSTARLLAQLRSVWPVIQPARYDDVADDAVPVTAPPPPVIEMAPYVGFRPWRVATPAELATQPLVIATPRNAYRLDLLARLFPHAQLRVLHLTRNPSASVNGLIDGWLHPGFHNVPVDEPLHIDGYSDVVPGGHTWWKFDVPPDWRAATSATLPEVCALQWWSAHEAVLEHVERTGDDCLRIRYEDLVGSRELRVATAARLAEWLGVPEDELAARVAEGIAPKMATARPRPRRWASGGNDITPALAQPKVWDVTARLGYDWDERLWI
jgi:hypothetical protein